MNYIDVKEACEKTNKSEKTIRRLFAKEESKPYLQKKGNVTAFTGFNVVQGEWFAEVVAVDGFGMFVRKEVWKAYPFDEKMLTGFHCYDVDFSLQIAVSKRYRNYVCCSPEVQVEHLSEGNYNRN